MDPGTSGANEPAWGLAIDAQTVDNTITWIAIDQISYWVGNYNLNRAAANGWLMKAGMLSGNYGLTIAGNQLQRQQAYDHAINQYRYYIRKAGLQSVAQRRYNRQLGEQSSIFGPLPVDSKFMDYRPSHRYLDATDPI
jgi:hypothetical protein